MSHRSCRRLPACTLILSCLLAPLACTKKESDDKTAPAATAEAAPISFIVQIGFRPTPKQQEHIDALLTKVDKESARFSNKELNRRANAPLFTYVAATKTDPLYVRAALSAMHVAYSTHSKRKATPDADYEAVVKYYLKSDNDAIVAAALLAARTGISGQDGLAGLIEPVIDLGARYPDGPGRFALIQTLQAVTASKRTEPLMAVYRNSLTSEHPYVQSAALQALYRSTRTINEPTSVKEQALALLAHADPGVRGRAVELLGAIGGDDKSVIASVSKSLDDSSGFVRAQACSALARLRHKPAIHKMMEMLADESSTRHDIRGFKQLDGRPGVLHHDGSPWSVVLDAAATSIRSLSGGELRFERVHPKQVTDGLQRNVAATRAWYKTAKARLPLK